MEYKKREDVPEVYDAEKEKTREQIIKALKGYPVEQDSHIGRQCPIQEYLEKELGARSSRGMGKERKKRKRGKQ